MPRIFIGLLTLSIGGAYASAYAYFSGRLRLQSLFQLVERTKNKQQNNDPKPQKQ